MFKQFRFGATRMLVDHCPFAPPPDEASRPHPSGGGKGPWAPSTPLALIGALSTQAPPRFPSDRGPEAP
eukprot:5663767-Alexandrium_andersonii.AAC.1